MTKYLIIDRDLLVALSPALFILAFLLFTMGYLIGKAVRESKHHE